MCSVDNLLHVLAVVQASEQTHTQNTHKQGHTCLPGNWSCNKNHSCISDLCRKCSTPELFPLGITFWKSKSEVMMSLESKDFFLGISFKAEPCQMWERWVKPALFSDITERDPRAHKPQWENIPAGLGTSQNMCEVETRTSRDSSWQLSCSGGRLTAIVTKACTKFVFFFMTRQARSLFQRNYLDDLSVEWLLKK